MPAYTFPATANVVELCGARAVLVDVDPETFLVRPELRRRGGDAAHPRGARRPPLRPARRLGGAPDGRAAGRRARRGRRRRARRPLPRHAVRRARAAGLPLVPPPEDRHDGGGRRRDDGRGGARRCGAPPAPPRHRGGRADGHRGAGLQLPPRRRPLRARRSRSSSASRACSPRGSASPAGTRSGSSTSSATPTADEGDRHGWQAYVVTLDRRDEALAGLREAGIEAQIGTYAVHRLSAYRDRGSFPGADAAFERALALPFATTTTEDEVDRVARRRALARSTGPSGEAKPRRPGRCRPGARARG